MRPFVLYLVLLDYTFFLCDVLCLPIFHHNIPVKQIPGVFRQIKVTNINRNTFVTTFQVMYLESRNQDRSLKVY